MSMLAPIGLAVVIVAVLVALLIGRAVPRKLPGYIDLPGSLAYPHPFVQETCTAMAFALQADSKALQKCVDGWLNIPINRRYRYVPLFPAVFLTSLAIGRMTCKTSPYSTVGWMRENDLTLAIPLVALRGIIPTHLAFAFAYLVVDQAVTMSTGRENFGYRKSFGKLDLSSDELRVPLSATTSVLEKHDPSCELKDRKVIEIKPPKNVSEGLESRFESFDAAAATIVRLLPDPWSLLQPFGVEQRFDLLSKLLTKSLPIAYLKQFRDIEAPEKARYQAVVESPMVITKFRRGGMLDTGFRIELADYDSFPMIRDLGLRSDYATARSGPVETFSPMFGFWADFDFDLDVGRVIAEAGADRFRL